MTEGFLWDDLYPTWSPDERYILAVHYAAGNDAELYKIDLETSTAEKMLDDPSIYSGDWSKHSKE